MAADVKRRSRHENQVDLRRLDARAIRPRLQNAVSALYKAVRRVHPMAMHHALARASGQNQRLARRQRVGKNTPQRQLAPRGGIGHHRPRAPIRAKRRNARKDGFLGLALGFRAQCPPHPAHPPAHLVLVHALMYTRGTRLLGEQSTS